MVHNYRIMPAPFIELAMKTVRQNMVETGRKSQDPRQTGRATQKGQYTFAPGDKCAGVCGGGGKR